jgi:hypothetical protein
MQKVNEKNGNTESCHDGALEIMHYEIMHHARTRYTSPSAASTGRAVGGVMEWR